MIIFKMIKRYCASLGPKTWLLDCLGLIDWSAKATASQVLTNHLRSSNYPYWTSFFLPYKSIINDQFGWSHFNWSVERHNYHVLRLGCYPYIKYHCTRRPYQDLALENSLYTLIKCINLGIPSMIYGLSATRLAKHSQTISVAGKPKVEIFFWYKENHNSPY
ncbi:hypothetical protein SSS_02080 [Sarcoptes scabiei]|uniref:Uncharacterized protein n=1 Tax=Sarcoptes scabiei TaxID=52283 RepID=A0A834VH52_SARSC|nr:hypothetical protein SSS_02080 [Sarcoptes scabiei]